MKIELFSSLIVQNSIEFFFVLTLIEILSGKNVYYSVLQAIN